MRSRLTFVALAAILWGLAGGIGGWLIAEGWDPLVVSFYRGLIGLLFVLLWLGVSPPGGGLAHPKTWSWSALAGLGIAGNFAFYSLSIAESGITIAATLMYCAPIFVFLVSFCLKLERASRRKGLTIAVVMVGIVLLTRAYDLDAGRITWLGAGAGLLAGLSYAVFIFGFKYAGVHGRAPEVLSIAFGTLAFVLFWLSDRQEIRRALGSESLAVFIALGVLGAGLSFVLYVVGIRAVQPSTASIIAMLEPVVAVLFGVFVLDEDLAVVQVCGIAMILSAVAALGS